MALPAGTLYAKGKPWYWESFAVKGDTWRTDFACRHLLGIESHDSGELIDRLNAMLEADASFPMEQDYGRDGCFDSEDLFLVWERADLAEMLHIISAAIDVSEDEA